MVSVNVAAQIAEINGVTCSKILCWATDLEQVTIRSMEIPNESHNPWQECCTMDAFNFDLFNTLTASTKSGKKTENNFFTEMAAVAIKIIRFGFF